MDTVPDIFDDLDHEAEERAWAEGEADADAERVVPHEDVKAWLKSWGTDHELPLPKVQTNDLDGCRISQLDGYKGLI